MKDQEKDDHFSESAFLNAPAPWELKGNAYICMLSCPPELLDNQSFIPESLRNQRQSNFPPLMMFVDYTHSPVGPYHELLFIPGRFTFEDGSQYLSISRIFVSSMDSVVNGRRNWGIPKEIADFEVVYDNRNLDRVIVRRQETIFAELAFRSFPLPLPFSTVLLPQRWCTLGQHEQSTTFIFRPKASGWLYPARLVETRIDSSEFPPVRPEHVRMAFKITHFQMLFPKAKISK